jgi:hypothetical protein
MCLNLLQVMNMYVRCCVQPAAAAAAAAKFTAGVTTGMQSLARASQTAF